MSPVQPHPTSPDSGQPSASLRGDLIASAACIGTAGLLAPFHATIDLANTAMLFLLVVALVAFALGRRPAVIAAFVSVALFDFFFVPPRLSFAVADAQYLVIVGVMLFVGLIITHLSQRLQARAVEAIERERQARALYGLASALAGSVDQTMVSAALDRFVADSIGGQACLLTTTESARAETTVAIDETLVRSVVTDGRPHRCANPGVAGGLRLLLPLQGTTSIRGVLLVDVDAARADALRQQQAMLEAVSALVAISIERLHYVEVAQSTALEMATERLRSSILSALSHDVRTPLTALYGLADSLTRDPPPAEARTTALAIRDQAMRLNGMATKLLDMARLKAGPPRLRREWQPLEEVIGSSLKLLGNAVSARQVQVSLPADLPLLEFDAVLIERVLCNLIENAAKSAGPEGRIGVDARLVGDFVEIAVTDTGPGFAPDLLAHAGDAFARGEHDTSPPGTGLGLAICRAIIAAHGGSIVAQNRPEGGACVAFSLPRGTPPAISAENE